MVVLMSATLARGFSATTARVVRPDWLRNAAGLKTMSYWRGTLTPRPTVDWYLAGSSTYSIAIVLIHCSFGGDSSAQVQHVLIHCSFRGNSSAQVQHVFIHC